MENQPDEVRKEIESLRAYAKQQGRLARQYDDGVGVPYYREVERRGQQIREAVPGHLLPADERERQRREAAKAARAARKEANRKARDLESK